MQKSTRNILYFFQICIITFQVFLLGFLILFNKEIFFNPSVKPISYEYWNWLTSHPDVINNKLVDFVISVYSVMNIIFILGFIIVITSKEFLHKMNIWKILLTLLVGYFTYIICIMLIRYFSPDYRLYMLFLPTEILSLLLLFFISRALYKPKTSKDDNELKNVL